MSLFFKWKSRFGSNKALYKCRTHATENAWMLSSLTYFLIDLFVFIFMVPFKHIYFETL